MVQKIEIQIGSTDASIRRKGSSCVTTAKILGTEVIDGIESVYLDRLVHGRGDVAVGWQIAGGVTTILRRQRVSANA